MTLKTELRLLWWMSWASLIFGCILLGSAIGLGAVLLGYSERETREFETWDTVFIYLIVSMLDFYVSIAYSPNKLMRDVETEMDELLESLQEKGDVNE